MVQINFAQKKVNAKIVYYGPGMSGKTTNLEIVHQRAPEPNRGELTSISTDGDRTLFFDFMPLDLGTVAGMRTCFQIYTVPGQVYYNSTRKLVLQGVDGVVFVADSSASMVEENLESLRNLEENLREYGKGIHEIPVILQYNKRDLPDALTVEELDAHLNPHGFTTYEAVANSGKGVFPTLKALAAEVLDSIHSSSTNAGRSNAGAPPAAAPPVTGASTGFYQTPVQAGPTPMQAPAAPPSHFVPGAQQPAQPAHAQQPHAPAQPQAAPAQAYAQQPAAPAPAPDPLSQTTVHAPPTVPTNDGGLQMAGSAPAAGAGLRMAGETRAQATAQQAPQAAPGAGIGSVMNVDQRSQAPSRTASRGRGFPQPEAPRFKPRATQATSGGGRSAITTVVFVVAALALGAVLGSIVLSKL